MGKAHLKRAGKLLGIICVLGCSAQDGSPQALTATSAGTERPPATRRYHRVNPGPRRWRGTVGTSPVTLQLDTSNYGSYSYDRYGRDIELGNENYQAHNPIRLWERDLTTNNATALWLLATGTRPAKLTGTWQSKISRRTAPIALREDYTDAVRYDEETWELKRGMPVDSFFTERDTVQVRYTCLRVHLPRNPVVEQRLQRALGPPVDRARMFEYFDTLTADYDRYDQRDEWLYVTCNTNYLLSFNQRTDFTEGERHEWANGRTFDLRTGRRLQLADLLRPGYQAPLRRLLRQAMRDRLQDYPQYPEVGTDGQLPKGGFHLTSTGFRFTYDDRDDQSLVFPGPYHADRILDTELSYAELLPLIRTDGPLNAMLRERGLWPPKPKPAPAQAAKRPAPNAAARVK